MNHGDADGHRNQIGEQRAFAENFLQTVYQRDWLLRLHAVFIRQNLAETFVGVVVPRPRINKRLRLCAVLPDVVVNLIVIALGIKRRVNIAKVNRFVADEFA